MVEKQILKDWLDFLKNLHSISNADVARSTGIGVYKLNNQKSGRTKVSRADLRKIVLAYPVLLPKAEAIGLEVTIDSPRDLPPNYDNQQADALIGILVQDIEQKYDKMAKDVAGMPNDLKKMADEITRLTEQLKAKDDHITRLLNLIERLSVGGGAGGQNGGPEP